MKSVPPRGTPTKPAASPSASFTAYPTPRGMISSRCKQVSRLSFILTGAPSHGKCRNGCNRSRLLRRLLHGFWESPGIAPGSCGAADRSAASRISAQIHRLFICQFQLYAAVYSPSISVFYILDCTIVSAMRFFSSSTLTTQTFTTSPTFTTSEGCRMNLSAIRLICTRPS